MSASKILLGIGIIAVALIASACFVTSGSLSVRKLLDGDDSIEIRKIILEGGRRKIVIDAPNEVKYLTRIARNSQNGCTAGKGGTGFSYDSVVYVSTRKRSSAWITLLSDGKGLSVGIPYGLDYKYWLLSFDDSIPDGLQRLFANEIARRGNAGARPESDVTEDGGEEVGSSIKGGVKRQKNPSVPLNGEKPTSA